HSLAQVWQMFTDRTGDPEAVQWAGQPYLWWEYGNYTGAYFWIVLIGLSFFIRRGDIPIVIVCCILLLLVLGDFAQWSPYNIMRALVIPILRHLRVPSRWSMPLLFTTAILGSIWLQRALKYTRRRPTTGRRAIVVSMCLFLAYGFYDLQIHNTRYFKLMFQAQAPHTTLKGDPIRTIDPQKVFGTVYSSFPAVRHNLSVHTAPEMLALRPVGWIAQDAPHNDEFRLSDDGIIRLLNWSPNEVRLHVRIQTPARLIYNQRYQTGWHADGYIVEDYSELISIKLPAGEHTIRLRYTDGLYITLLLLCGGLHVLCLFVWLYATKRVRKSNNTL
ncbi:MAG: hypothetical protein KDK34_10475, partial [Leptospiraceae bacterium]|nr:hypothetical protein [Leptospiraceae bacterium]